MKRIFMPLGLVLLIFLAACNSAESKELLEYHNGLVDKVLDRMEEIDEGYDKIDIAESDDEVIEIAQQDMLPVLEEIKAYMEDQNPEKEDTKEYHKLRMEWVTGYYDLVTTELQAMEDYINDDISEEEFDNIVEDLYTQLEEVNDLSVKADDKIDELSEKYEFEEIEE